MKEIISARAAAKIIGCNPQAIRMHMKKGIWKIGKYIPNKEGKRAEYLIYTRLLCQELGIPEEVAEERLNKNDENRTLS